MSTNSSDRNRPAGDGKDHDPDLRDRSAIQPGTSTISKSSTDKDNEALTKTGADDFREEKDDDRADPSFDEIGGE
jgi:hypothetical protein